MNIKKIIKNEFSFLEDLGYKRRVFAKNGDYEFYYSKDNIVIEALYSLNIPKDFTISKSTNINETIANSFYSFTVIVEHDSIIENIFDSHIFSPQVVDKLMLCVKGEENIQKIIHFYALFINDNLSILNNKC